MSGHALVLGDGDAPDRAGLDGAWPGWDEGIALVVAADGGARLAASLGVAIDRWVGDADSYPRSEVDVLAATGVAVRIVPTAKDESDLELAVLEAVALGTDRITVLGALGGPRLDHELANVALLAHPALAGIDVELLDERTRARLLTGPASASLAGRTGDVVSLLPLGDVVEGITTTGLGYPLAEEPLRLGPARGLSNVRTDERATIAIREGRLLVVETPATVGS
ncbi:MAG TPA: thiamine diphosphokinase [Candidatus Limnocylindrales bacterium]|nr:thiamine diphosphokinase [Candidatus Limnocylindrales bacterium]